MTLIPLSDLEWDAINNTLPSVNFINEIIITWPYMEDIVRNDINLVKCLRLSQVRFRDAWENIRRARYALGQAIAVRKFYMDKIESLRDNYHALADLNSRFYADYVPLLLFASVEHARVGILDLFDFKSAFASYKGPSTYKLRKTLSFFNTQLPNSEIVTAISRFDQSRARQDIWEYRDKWFHHKPMRIESIFYNPPYEDFVMTLDPWQMAAIGAKKTPNYDYSWDDFIEKLKDALEDTARFTYACVYEWDKKYNL